METKNIGLQLKVQFKPNQPQDRKNKKTLGDPIEKCPDVVDTHEVFSY